MKALYRLTTRGSSGDFTLESELLENSFWEQGAPGRVLDSSVTTQTELVLVFECEGATREEADDAARVFANETVGSAYTFFQLEEVQEQPGVGYRLVRLLEHRVASP